MKRFHLLFAAALAGFALVAAAGGEHAHRAAEAHPHPNKAGAVPEQTDWGIAAGPGAAARVIRITMSDAMRFSPSAIEVKQGETVKFVIHNAGRLRHEMVLGTRKELKRHAELMKKFPGMEHEEAYMAHVEPGRSGSLVWTFNRAGDFQFACLVPGHYEAGMKGRIRVGTGQPAAGPASASRASGRRP